MSDHYASLYIRPRESREGIDAQNMYAQCVRQNLHSYKTSGQLKELMEREDVNSICEEELNTLKSLASKIGVKETRAIYHNIIDVKDLLN